MSDRIVVDQLAMVLDDTDPLVAAVRPEQWAAPTPCPEWTVRTLVTHMVAGNRLVAASLGDEPMPEPTDVPPGPPVDPLDSEPAAAFRAAADLVVAAFRRPGALEAQVTVPLGTVPGIVALHLRITEILVHGWDLARATGQATRYRDDIVEQELVFTRGKLGDIPPTRRPFAPPQPVPNDAPAIDRLAACLGRAVTARADPG